MDCALAELYTKSTALERSLEGQKHAEVMSKLYLRMNEVSSAVSSMSRSAKQCLHVHFDTQAVRQSP